MTVQHFHFIGSSLGMWEIVQMDTRIGEPLAHATHLEIIPHGHLQPATQVWNLRGFTSNHRYTDREEKEKLVAIQASLGRTEATRAALIPIRKTEAWWALAQDERRAIFETRSHHTTIGLKYLPAIARKLYHCRDIGEPFDFLTWFEYAPAHATAFEDLVAALRETEEWAYIDREIDIRLSKVS